jgi:hypothetical protein
VTADIESMDSFATAFARTLKLDANPELRDHLAGIVDRGEASERELETIPLLAGKLSANEERGIRRTLQQIDMEPPPALSSYLLEAADARRGFIASWNAEGARNHKAAILGMIGSGAAGVALAIWMLVTKQAPPVEAVLDSGLAASFGAVLSTVYGFSRAGVIDGEISSYGVYD